MSSKRQNLVNQLRFHYQKKFGNITQIQNLLEVELSKLNEKEKISANDLKDLESRIFAKCEEMVQKNLFESSPKPIKNHSRVNLRPINKESDDSFLQTIASPSNESLAGSPKIYPYYLKKEIQEFPKMKVSHSLNLSAIDIKNLQFHNTSGVAEDKTLKKMKSGNVEPSFIDDGINDSKEFIKLGDLSRFKLSPIHKTQQREELLKQDIWKKIDEYNMKKFDQEEMNKKVKAKQNQEKWLNGLQKQVEETQKKKFEQKLKTQEDGKRYINQEIEAQINREQPIELHKQRIKSIERENYLNSLKMQELRRAKKLQERERIRELTSILSDQSKEEKNSSMVVEEKLKKKEQLEKMMQEAELVKSQKLQKKMLQNEQDNKVIHHMMEKMEQDEKSTQNFIEKLRERARAQKDPVPVEKKKRGYDNLRRYGSIGGYEVSKGEGIMGFLDSDAHNESIQKEKKQKAIEKLQQVHEVQKNDKSEKKKVHEKMQHEQKLLWIKEEELMNAREEINVEVEKLKKQMTKHGLDAQRESNENHKKGHVTSNEVWVNRKLLRELKAVPDGSAVINLIH